MTEYTFKNGSGETIKLNIIVKESPFNPNGQALVIDPRASDTSAFCDVLKSKNSPNPDELGLKEIQRVFQQAILEQQGSLPSDVLRFGTKEVGRRAADVMDHFEKACIDLAPKVSQADSTIRMFADVGDPGGRIQSQLSVLNAKGTLIGHTSSSSDVALREDDKNDNPAWTTQGIADNDGSRFGDPGSVAAGSFGDAGSPLSRALAKYPRSEASVAPTTVATAPWLAPTNTSESGVGSRPGDELYAARERAARMLAGVGRYIENGLIPSAQAASPSGSLYNSPTSDADGSQPPIRRLVGQIIDDPRISAPAAPSPPDLNPFGGHFGNPTSTGAGDTPPQQSQDSTPPYSEMFLQYLNQLTAGQSQAPASSSNKNAPAPYQPVPPIFASPDYSSTTGNGSIERWIASLAGVDPDDPTQFQAPPIFSPVYGR